MKRTQQWARAKPGLTGAGLTAGVGLLLWFFVPGLSELSYDLLFLLRPTRPVEGLSIVYMDETTAAKLDEPMLAAWNRDEHAKMIRRLMSAKARVIVFDVLFDKPSNSDRAFLDAVSNACARGSPVIVSAKPNREAGPGFAATVKRPFPELEKLAAWGLVVGEESTDQTIRRHVMGENAGWPSLASRVAAAVGQPVPPAGRATRWINYYGPPGTMPSYRYGRVLEPDFDTSVFSNQVVLVGGLPPDVPYLAGKGTDEWPTPWSRLGQRKAPGAEVSATACLNYMQQAWLTRPSAGSEAGILLVTGASCGFGLAWFSVRRAVVVGLLSALGMMAGAVMLMSYAEVWFPWLVVAGVQIPVALGCALATRAGALRRRNELLEKELAGRGVVLETGVIRQETSTDASAATPVTTVDPNTAYRPSAERGNLPLANQPFARADAMALPIPDHVLLRRVGRGAYGEVWLARNAIGTFHAVKLVRREDFEHNEPFEREFRGLQKFMPISREHPGLVQVLHVGRNERDGFFYYVMQAADDELSGQQIVPDTYQPKNLAREIARKGKLTVKECLSLGIDLAGALEFLHQQGLVHRDIKPANIIFVRGTPRLADIGLVTDIATTKRGVSYLGTMGFIPPEGPGTPAADVFSLGKVLYEASMGREAGSFPELPETILSRADAAALLQLNQILLTACHEQTAARYASAAQLRTSLLELQSRLEQEEVGR